MFSRSRSYPGSFLFLQDRDRKAGSGCYINRQGQWPVAPRRRLIGLVDLFCNTDYEQLLSFNEERAHKEKLKDVRSRSKKARAKKEGQEGSVGGRHWKRHSRKNSKRVDSDLSKPYNEESTTVVNGKLLLEKEKEKKSKTNTYESDMCTSKKGTSSSELAGNWIATVPATDNSPAVPERTTVETVLYMSAENKAHFESEKEAIHLILTGIGDEIYLTVDACKLAHEMWEAIERL
ncbi:hypothetical protein Tco_0866178 [Tanacetum coccineum]